MNRLLRRTDGKIRWGTVVGGILIVLAVGVIKSTWSFGVQAYNTVMSAPTTEARLVECEHNDVALAGKLETTNRLLEENIRLQKILIELNSR